MKVKEILKNCSEWIPGSGYTSEKPVVSVLLPTFQRAKSGFFSKAVDSVLKQSFQDLELIIIDDASKDGTADLISDFMEKDPRVSCIRHTYNVGLPAISEYEGYIKARGEFIAFIFDDNEWQEDALSDTIRLMQEKDLKATYGVSRLYYVVGEIEKYDCIGDSSNSNTSEIYCSNFMANASVVLHRDVLETVGLYDPHLALTRVCDWDLWRRVSDRFDFYGTGIYFTDEHGAKLNDSLGNSHKMDSWTAEERMQYSRNQMLLPENYPEVDIFDSFGCRSEFFMDSMLEYAEQYKGKKWFNKKDRSLLAFVQKKAINRDIKRVAVIFPDYSPSITLVFSRIFKKAEHVVKYFKMATYYTGYLAMADCIVLDRNLYAAQAILNLAKTARIPCYYFVDDNFRKLAEDIPDDYHVALFAKLTTRETLSEYDGIILSSKALLQYFKEENLHDNLILLRPSIDTDNISSYHVAKKKSISIAFLGGGFRYELLRAYVLPALQKLSHDFNVSFYCPEGSVDRGTLAENSRLNIIFIPRDFSLNKTINRYAEKGIDIQIHCGPDIRNNIYKTKNALLNATQLGAVLVASSVQPFTVYDGDKNTYLLSKNTEEDWYNTLKNLASNSKLRKNIYDAALKYCMDNCTGEITARDFDRELRRTPSISYYRIKKQYEALYLLQYKSLMQAQIAQIQAAAPAAEPPKRVIESDKLCISRQLGSEKRYTVICSSRDASQIGVIFTSMGNAMGTVTIRISMKGCFLRESSLPIDGIKNNEWTYFPVSPLYNCGGRELDITINVQYKEASDKLFVYEDVRNRNFWYKAFNKLGFNFRIGKNVLYTDFRR